YPIHFLRSLVFYDLAYDVCSSDFYFAPFVFFFFQAEDGIRDRNVTGVQTCALPISDGVLFPSDVAGDSFSWIEVEARSSVEAGRSEERRVGKESRYRWATSRKKKKKKEETRKRRKGNDKEKGKSKE